MTTKINGTNTAASPAITGADTDTGLSFGTDTVNINTGGVTRATVNSSGNLGIGTTSPDQPLHIKSNTPYIKFEDDNDNQDWQIEARSFFSIYDVTDSAHRLVIDGDGNVGINKSDPSYPLVARRTDASGIVAEFANSSGYGLFIGQASATGEAYLRTGTGQALAFKTNGDNERMRIDSSGNLFIHSTNSSGSNGRIYTNKSTNHTTLEINQNSGSGTEMITFRNSGSQIGQITQSGSGVSYGTSSDYRLKENDVAISDGITRIKQLRPIRFNFIADADTTLDGFFAHEVTPVVPEAITGEKDAVFTAEEVGNGNDVEGAIKSQTIDQSKLVPLLTAALQEAVAKIEVLETKVAALEAG
jgi:hypothetical protein